MVYTLYDHRWMDMQEDTNGEAFVRMASDAIMTFAVTEDNEVVLIREKSIAFQREALSLPTGAVEENEPPAITANRELQEETGFQAATMQYLGTLHPSIKYMAWRCHIYLARNLHESRLVPDETSPITVELLPLKGLDFAIESGRLSDSTAVAAVYLATRQLAREQQSRFWKSLFVSR
jgi:ADP-ribose pyrophosphatase